MSTAATTHLAAARLRAAEARPYYASALFALEPVRADGDRPVTVDAAGRLLWTDCISGESVATTATRIIHGLEHLLRDHAGRSLQWVPRIGTDAWARACDCEIDDDLDDLDLPDDLITATSLDLPEGRAAEWYAAHFAEQEAAESEAAPSEPGDDPEDGDAEAPADGRGGHVCGCPATAEGAPADAPDLSEARIEQLRTEVADAVAGRRGNVPAGIARWAAERTKPKTVDWRALLLREVRRSTRRTLGADDHCSRRPSRRSPHPVLLPRLRARAIQPAVVIDTSGSIRADDLADAVQAMRDLLRTLTTGEPVAVIACDTEVHAVARVQRAGDIELAGGGGSDMTAGIDAAIDSGADVVIVLTDGYVDWPDARQRVPVIAGLLGDSSHRFLPDHVPTVRIGESR